MPLRIALQIANTTSGDRGHPYSRVTSWLSKILYIIFSLGFGVALLCLPWLSFWENNSVLNLYPQLRPLISNSYFK